MSNGYETGDNISGDIQEGNVHSTGIAIGSGAVAQVTTIYEWSRRQPTDPQTVEAARALLATLPINTFPNRAPLPPGSRMPFSATPSFVGRVPDLLSIAAALKGEQTTAISQAATVHGLGGVGKTTVATEFVHRYGAYFAGGVFWLSFADPVNIGAEIAQCGGEGGLQLRPDFHDLPLPDQVAAVQRAWAEEIPRLLVFDNVDTDDAEALVQQYRPTTGGARVLITSRRGVWDASLGITALQLGTLPRAESIALLRWFRADLPEADAAAIATELGDLPLALHLVGSFLKKYDHTQQGDPSAFLGRLRDPALLEHPALQGRATGVAWSYQERSVARAFALSYERLTADDATDDLALELLARAAHFAPGEPISRDLLLATVETSDELLATRALERLTTLGLLELDDGSPTLHRLLAHFVQSTATADAAQAAVEKAVTDYTGLLEDIPAAWLPLVPHLRHITDAALERGDEQAATLANNLGYCLNNVLADYGAARPLMERALAIHEQVLGAEHPHTAVSLNNLAELLRLQGDYAAARQLVERALAIHERVLGAEHPHTAIILDSLAGLLLTQGDYSAARPLLEQVLAIREQTLGPYHPDYALSLNNLAGLHYRQEDYETAQQLYEQALEVREQVLGPDHPSTATSLNNLSILLYNRGGYQQAYTCMHRALSIRESTLGVNHQLTAESRRNLGTIAAKLESGNTEQILDSTANPSTDAASSRATTNSVIHWNVGSVSHPGKVRSVNEDSMLRIEFGTDDDSEERRWGLYAIADGLGGHQYGKHASQLAVDTINEVVSRAYGDWIGNIPPNKTILEVLLSTTSASIEEAHRRIKAEAHRNDNDMGTTLTMTLFAGRLIVIANIGDSRTYLFRKGELQRRTKDHSLVMRLVELGQISEDEIYTHPQRNNILQHLGDRQKDTFVGDSDVLFRGNINPGDKFLLCSDGQWEMTRDPEMKHILASHEDPQEACQMLVDAANHAGGEDNISTLAVFFDERIKST
jgi:serine/threonine protein phosphatase PrpC/tetratricopeptide (TPR) repeat protein